jgi:hypothetical protein
MDIVSKSIIFYLVNNNPIHLKRLENSLKFLQKNFLKNYPYPVVFGHEDVSNDILSYFSSLVSSKTFTLKVNFNLPDYSADIKNKIPERFKGHWDENAFFSMGYRHMCNFYAGEIFNYAFFNNVRFFMRMDCDSYFIDSLSYDPFKIMEQDQIIYGTTGIEEDMDYVIEGLPDFCKNFFKTTPNNIKYNGMYKTHFEIIDFQWFKNSLYKDFFDSIKKTGNIYIKRWGDAPIRYQGVQHLLSRELIKCFDLPYKHGGDVIFK